MKRSIELYINGARVDLDAEALILFNYRFEELSNPTIVKNSYSQTITLKSTDTNNRVFGAFYRSDRAISAAIFDPKRKVPFQIFDGGTLLEAGYAKLENVVTKNGVAHEYKVGLFGGLGSFFYGLSYDDAGNKKTLASLDYGREVGFTINANTVKQAWDYLTPGPYTGANKWQIVNFAPCYNGIPTDDFDADKMLVRADEVGLPTVRQDGDDTYRVYQNITLVKLGRKVNEWEAHDLRSYLQRAVVRFRAVLAACCDSAQNGGYSVVLDPSFFNDENPYYNDLWLALPQVHKLNGLGEGDNGTFSFPAGGGDIHLNAAVDLSIPFGTETSIEFGVRFTMEPRRDPAGDVLYGSAVEDGTVHSYAWLVQVVGYDSNGAEVAGSSVELLQTRIAGAQYGADWVAREIGYNPAYNAGFDALNLAGQWERDGSGWVWSRNFTGIMTAANLSRVELVAIPVHIIDSDTAAPVVMQQENVAYSYESQTEATNPQIRVDAIGLEGIANANRYEYEAASSVRSNSRITKDALLATEHTPAEYLIAFAKVFGLQFMVDREAKTVSILTRDTFFSAHAADIIDLTDRVDRSKDITVTPFLFDTKWLELAFEADDIQFAEEYLNAYGRKYGAARINTGFEFNSETKELLDGLAVKGGVEVLERSKMFNNITEAGKPVPSAFLDAGEFTLYKNSVPGDDKTFPLPIPTAAAAISYWNDTYLGYDAYSKPQFHGSDQKELDLRDTFLLYGGRVSLDGKYFGRVKITDDDEYMAVLNDNTPCWHGGAYGIALDVTNYPLFGRYTWSGSRIVRSLDFGMPAEVDIPGVGFEERAGLYDRFWERFLSDRYDDDARVMKCSVDLSGLQVDAELLRRFFYYDGALWSMNAIENHSVTTFDPTLCEFVKVIDILNYTGGQTPAAHSINALPATIEFDPYGSTVQISVTASGPWTAAVVGIAGVTLSAYSGTGDATITATAPQNQGTALAGQIVFTLTETGDTAAVEASQGIPGAVGVSPNSVDFCMEGDLWREEWGPGYQGRLGRYEIAVTTGRPEDTWKITSLPSWVKAYRNGNPLLVGSIQTGPGTFEIVADPNYSWSSKDDDLTIEFTQGGDVVTKTVRCQQSFFGWALMFMSPESGDTVEIGEAPAGSSSPAAYFKNGQSGDAATVGVSYEVHANRQIGDGTVFPGVRIEYFDPFGRNDRFDFPARTKSETQTVIDNGGIARGVLTMAEAQVAKDLIFKISINAAGAGSFHYAASGAAGSTVYDLVNSQFFKLDSAAILPYILIDGSQEISIAPDGSVSVNFSSNSVWLRAQCDLYDARQIIFNGKAGRNIGVDSFSVITDTFSVTPNHSTAVEDFKVVYVTDDADIVGTEIRGGVLTTILVHQQPLSWDVPGTITRPASGGGAYYFSPSTNFESPRFTFYGASSESWCHVTPETPGSPYLVLTLDANTTGAQRTCVVTVYCQWDGTSKQVTIIQEA